jgi:hypothetical protein
VDSDSPTITPVVWRDYAGVIITVPSLSRLPTGPQAPNRTPTTGPQPATGHRTDRDEYIEWDYDTPPEEGLPIGPPEHPRHHLGTAASTGGPPNPPAATRKSTRIRRPTAHPDFLDTDTATRQAETTDNRDQKSADKLHDSLQPAITRCNPRQEDPTDDTMYAVSEILALAFKTNPTTGASTEHALVAWAPKQLTEPEITRAKQHKYTIIHKSPTRQTRRRNQTTPPRPHLLTCLFEPSWEPTESLSATADLQADIDTLRTTMKQPAAPRLRQDRPGPVTTRIPLPPFHPHLHQNLTVKLSPCNPDRDMTPPTTQRSEHTTPTDRSQRPPRRLAFFSSANKEDTLSTTDSANPTPVFVHAPSGDYRGSITAARLHKLHSLFRPPPNPSPFAPAPHFPTEIANLLTRYSPDAKADTGTISIQDHWATPHPWLTAFHTHFQTET